MNSDIKLRRVDDPMPERNELPRGVHAIILDNRVIFVRRVGGRFIPLPAEEQERLKNKHIV